MPHESLTMWTLYQNPADFPGQFVLREFRIEPTGPVPLPGVFLSASAAPLRAQMEAQGRVCFAREPNDEPQIVETWL